MDLAKDSFFFFSLNLVLIFLLSNCKSDTGSEFCVSSLTLTGKPKEKGEVSHFSNQIYIYK